MKSHGLTSDLIYGKRTDANTVTVPLGKTLEVLGTLSTASVTLTSPLVLTAGTHAISLTDNTATVFQIKEGSNNYLKMDTTNSSELITLGVALKTTGNTTIQAGTHSIAMTDNVATVFNIAEGATSYLKIDTTDSSELITLGKALKTTGNTTIQAGTHAISVTDNVATVFQIKEAANNYFKIDTTDASELITLGVNTTLASTMTLAVTTADKLTVGAVIVPQSMVVPFTVTNHATNTTQTIFYAQTDGWTVTGVVAVPDLAEGGARTGTICKVTGNSAPVAATTPLHSSTINCNGTANTPQVMTLTGTGADLILAATDKIGIKLDGALATGKLSGYIKLKRS